MGYLSLMIVNKDWHVESAERGCGMTEGRAEEAKAEGGYRGLAPYFTIVRQLLVDGKSVIFQMI